MLSRHAPREPPMLLNLDAHNRALRPISIQGCKLAAICQLVVDNR